MRRGTWIDTLASVGSLSAIGVPMMLLSSAGTTLMWVLVMTLWLPIINYSRTYKDVAEQIATLRGVSVEEIGARTTATAREFFKFER